MAHLIQLTQHACNRGDLTVFERILPGSLKRIFYITNADGSTRGGHRHHKAWQAVICLQGSVEIVVERADGKKQYLLDSPHQCLILEPQDWNLLKNFRDTAIVLVVSNEYYEADDYIYERYNSRNSRESRWPTHWIGTHLPFRMKSYPINVRRTVKLLVVLSGLTLGLLSCRNLADSSVVQPTFFSYASLL